jgi:hypothetical protein
MNEGDLVLVSSDGVYDNLDPQHLGKTPKVTALFKSAVRVRVFMIA